MNTAIFRSAIWQMKIFSLALGIILLGLTASQSFYVLYTEAEFFLGVIILTFMISFVWIVFALIDALSENEILSKMDFFYHVIGGLLLIIGAICWLVASTDLGDCKGTCEGDFVQNIFGGIFGFLNGALYFVIAFFLFRASRNNTTYPS